MIYILDNDPTVCSQMLDDKSLDKMIKDIAQVLCNVHHLKVYDDIIESGTTDIDFPAIPLRHSKNILKCKWSLWASKCKANYLYLVELGMACCLETQIRHWAIREIFAGAGYSDEQINNAEIDLYEGAGHTNQPVILWARDNVPDLPSIFIRAASAPISHSTEQPTPFPLVMPKKYIVWCVEGEANEELSYQAYYKAKLNRVVNNCERCGDSESPRRIGTCNLNRWTRREVPAFIKDIL